MIHANPGVVVLNDGVVVGKWTIADIPSVEVIENSSIQVDGGIFSYGAVKNWPLWVFVLFGVVSLLSLLSVVVARAAGSKEERKVPDGEKSENESSDIN
jgi:hypothetical protein